MSGRRFLAYFFDAVVKEVWRQQAKHYNQKGNNRSALSENKQAHSNYNETRKKLAET